MTFFELLKECYSFFANPFYLLEGEMRKAICIFVIIVIVVFLLIMAYRAGVSQLFS